MMLRGQIAHGVDTRLLTTQRVQHRCLVGSNGADDAFTSDGDVHFLRFSLTYSAMVLTFLKMAFPSAGEANLMP